jgi:proton-dependent oligopeptide transporter, POT family
MAFEGSGSKQYLDVGSESYLVTSEGRGDSQKLTIQLPDGPQTLSFDNKKFADLTPVAGGAPERLAENAYVVESEPPTLVRSLCTSVGLTCGEVPASRLKIEGRGDYPIRADGGDAVIDINGAAFKLVEGSTTDAVATNAAGVEVRRIPDGQFESRVEQEALYVQILYLSLALIIVGVGFLKANISTTVGALYPPGDPRRDGGFTIFYMGINLGAFLATLLCGYLGQTYGWKYGFGLAGIGMLFGLVQYLMGQKWLQGKADPPKPIGALTEGLFWVGGLLAVIPAWLLVQQSELMEHALPIVVPLLFVAVLGYAVVAFKGEERGKMIAALALIMFSVVFWMLFEQAGSSLSLFAERSTDLTVIPGVEMTAAQTQSFNAGFIVLLAIPFSMMWVWLSKRKLEPSTPVKFALALFQVGIGFFVLVFGAQFAGPDFKVPLIFLALLYLLHTTGELFLSPVGLSMITKLSAARVVGLMMGVWFLSSSLAHILAAQIAKRTSSQTIGGQVVDPGAQLETYVTVFTAVGILGIASGVVLLVLSPFIKKWMADVH